MAAPTPSQFRAAMPAFKDDTDERIQRALDIMTAKPYVDSTWEGDEARGWNLGIGHFIAMEKEEERIVAAGPGAAIQQGATLKTVGRVTVGRSSEMAMRYEEDHWLLTLWGKQFRQLARAVGLQGIHVV